MTVSLHDLDEACPTCVEYLSTNWHNLRGACASVGIEHARTTDDMLDEHMVRHHAKHGGE